MDKIYLTQEGYEKLKQELEHLKTTKRRKLSDEIGKARALGDISENAEYDAAKEAQGINEKKIAEIEQRLAVAQIIDESQMATDEVLIGATVEIQDIETSEKETYTLVSETEADFANSRISVTSPVGKALLGHKKDDFVDISVPAGILKYKILNITRQG
jgi:transcription elongation factor GreA